MQTADFDFKLPPELIAQQPAPQRDHSRLLVLHRADARLEHKKFSDLLGYLRAGDVLVFNNSRVIPARLRGKNASTGGAFEMLLLEETSVNNWWAMMKPGKRAQLGTQIQILNRQSAIGNLLATVREINSEGHRRLEFSGTKNISHELAVLGEIPLPPYIRRDAQQADDLQRYQTVYSQPLGSVAAPTAGLHFTPELLEKIHALGVEIHFVTLHVGLGTFAGVHATELADHQMHEERYVVSDATARAVNTAKREARRVIAVGTTSVRVLESVAAQHDGQIIAGEGRTKTFIYPPREFKIVNALFTNFHVPCSTLLMLVSAFAAPGETRGRELVLVAYAEAIRERYRFFSYGDAMLLV
ncbi:MAG: hypothetical protein RLZZ350_654 [Verrucomicrobiota bacterium]|jgi:S-adenosylmethionine:tRNA ribosyltransferase-isomerase